MMLQFQCPSCNTVLQAAEDHAGKTIRCPQCGASAAVPAADGAITAAPVPTSITTPENTKRSKSARDRDESSVPTPVKAGMGIGMILFIAIGGTACALFCVVAILIALLVPAVQKVREAAARQQTMNNMKQIGMGWHNHEATFKEFPVPKMRAQPPAPPNASVDLSWRVSLLPFLEQNNLFMAIDKNVAWDHPNNRQLSNTAVPLYLSVWRSTDTNHMQTRFQTFTGPNTMFPDVTKSIRIANITDGTSNTFMFAESQTLVPWAKPADIAMTPNGPIDVPPDRFLACMADGSVRFIDRRSVNDATLRLLIDPRDNQVIPPVAFID